MRVINVLVLSFVGSAVALPTGELLDLMTVLYNTWSISLIPTQGSLLLSAL